MTKANMTYLLSLFFLVVLSFSEVACAEIKFDLVHTETLNETIQLDGVIEAVQESTVSAQTSGTVQQIFYDVDDSVEAGDLIVKLEDSEQRARLSQAKGQLREAEASHTNALQQFERVRQVHEQGYISRQEFDQAQNRLSAAKASMERARAAVEEVREQLDYTTVHAPYSGILTERHIEIGEAVSPGQPLLSGLSLEQLRVVVNLPQKYAEKVRSERSAKVTLADGRALKTGEMTFYPYADSRTHTFRLRLELEEPEGTLYPGMLVKVDVPAATRQALWIPASSLIRRSELRAVYVLDQEDKPRLRQIRTGVRHNGLIEVLAGLDEGEKVVTNPEILPDKNLNSDQESDAVSPGTSE